MKGESDLSLDREYYEISQLLCDASWEGRWNPLRETNVAPIAAGVAEIVAPALASERSRADRLEQKLEELRPYLAHRGICAHMAGARNPHCSCGLDRLLASVEENRSPDA